MKRGYSKILYNQLNKDETILSVIKRLFGEHVTSRLVRTQNRELSFRCIAYNTYRLTNLTIITWFLQSLAQSISPSLAGYIFQSLSFLSALFVLGGVMKIAYDVILYLNFRNMKAPGEKQ